MASAEHVDPDAIKLIKDLVDNQLLPALMESHKIASDDIKARLDAIKECEKQSREQDKGVQNHTATVVNNARVLHRDCRDKELRMMSIKRVTSAWNSCFSDDSDIFVRSASLNPSTAFSSAFPSPFCSEPSSAKAFHNATPKTHVVINPRR